MKWTEENRYTEEDIEPWRTQAISLLEQALGSNVAGCYQSVFDNWRTHESYGYGEEGEIEYAQDVKRALPRAVNALTQVIEYFETLTVGARQEPEEKDIWSSLHPKISEIARPRFEAGYLSDAVETSFKEVNDRVKSLVKIRTGQEDDGASFMKQAFSLNKPIISLSDLSTKSGQSEQQGYMEIFAGAMTGIRNPKAHSNVVIDEKRATHLLYLASLLMYKLDEAK